MQHGLNSFLHEQVFKDPLKGWNACTNHTNSASLRTICPNLVFKNLFGRCARTVKVQASAFQAVVILPKARIPNKSY